MMAHPAVGVTEGAGVDGEQALFDFADELIDLLVSEVGEPLARSARLEQEDRETVGVRVDVGRRHVRSIGHRPDGTVGGAHAHSRPEVRPELNQRPGSCGHFLEFHGLEQLGGVGFPSYRGDIAYEERRWPEVRALPAEGVWVRWA